MIIDGLEVVKEKKGYRIIDGEREFTIDKNGNVSSDWFCSYETVIRILDYIDNQSIISDEEE